MIDSDLKAAVAVLKHFALIGLATTLACATGGKPVPTVDLAPAREAVAKARESGADTRAPDALRRAEDHLKDAEAMAGSGTGDARERAQAANSLARLAVTEAACAFEMSRLTVAAEITRASSSGAQQLQARLRRAEEDQRKLEERVAFLTRELEMTETEVIRTKARLKGNETKAGASSAIAEARILARRLMDDRTRAVTLARCRELIARAEQLLQEENFGAAVFFALKAQDTAVKAQEAGAASAGAPPETDSPATKSSYVVTVPAANIRRGPATSEPVIATAPKGTPLDASVVRGDWIRVRFRSATGWVHRSVVE